MRPLIALFACGITGLSVGCFGPNMTVDGRTALEQELTRLAIQGAIHNLPIHEDAMSGTWRLTITAPDAKDVSWIQSCLELTLKASGVRLSNDAAADLPRIEARVLMAGSDVDNFAVGVPASLVGGRQTLSFYQSISEYGRAAVSLVFWTPGEEKPHVTPEINHRVHYTTQYFLTVIGPLSANDIEERTWGRFLDVSADSFMQAKRQGEWILPGDDAPPIQRTSGRQ